jgi:hypothetical protein
MPQRIGEAVDATAAIRVAAAERAHHRVQPPRQHEGGAEAGVLRARAKLVFSAEVVADLVHQHFVAAQRPRAEAVIGDVDRAVGVAGEQVGDAAAAAGFDVGGAQQADQVGAAAAAPLAQVAEGDVRSRGVAAQRLAHAAERGLVAALAVRVGARVHADAADGEAQAAVGEHLVGHRDQVVDAGGRRAAGVAGGKAVAVQEQHVEGAGDILARCPVRRGNRVFRGDGVLVLGQQADARMAKVDQPALIAPGLETEAALRCRPAAEAGLAADRQQHRTQRAAAFDAAAVAGVAVGVAPLLGGQHAVAAAVGQLQPPLACRLAGRRLPARYAA